MFQRVRRTILGATAAVALTAAVGGVALAQTPTPGAATARPDPSARAEQFLGALATKLGTTSEAIRNALQAVQKERLAEDVAAGRLTQTQADAIAQRSAQMPFGGPGFGPGGKGFGPGGRGGPGHEMRGGPIGHVDVATFLGIPEADLKTALQGKSLAQVAQENGKTRDALKTFLTDAEKPRLTQAVADGRITQAQADERLAAVAVQIDTHIDRVHPAASEGRGPGMRFGRGGPGGASPVTATPGVGA